MSCPRLIFLFQAASGGLICDILLLSMRH